MSDYSMDRLSKLGSKASNSVKSFGSKASNSVKSFGSKASNSVKSLGSSAASSASSLGSSVASSASSLGSSVASSASSLGSSAASSASSLGTSVQTNMKGGNTYLQILKVVLIAGLIYLILFMIGKSIRKRYLEKMDNPYIIKDSKNCKNSLTIIQDPSQDGSITLYRSDNKEGAQFTYSCWILIDNLQYQYGKWKHVFHKGNKSSYPNRAPGVWIHPTNNALRIYMNTFDDILDYVDIENIPIKKWISLVIVLNTKYMDVYINGYLKKRKELTSLPRQNYGNLWVNLFGGFDGYMSKFRYFNYALDYKAIDKIVKSGPSKDRCSDTGEAPPYLDDDWWFNK